MYLEPKYNGETQRKGSWRAGRDQNMQRAWKDTSQSRRLHEDRLACTVAAPIRSREKCSKSKLLKVWSPTSTTGATRELVSSTESQAPLPTYSIQTHILIRPPGASHT